ncbi:MAG: citramalate synthase [Clostridia bacterium]|nr:citramalate synthase [Clostridia bacterium]
MQGAGIAFSVDDKLKIARALDAMGIAYVEAGNPGSNPKDMEFFRRIQEQPLKNAKLCAFGSTRRKGIRAEEDANLASLIEAGTPAVSFFGKSWDLHVEKVLGATLEENLRMIEDTAAFLKSRGRYVIFDAEHFFDGYAANPEYALRTLKAAESGGADLLCLCDTNGGTYFADIQRIVETAAGSVSRPIGIHTHNDTGMAVAQAMAAVDGGAVHVQGTFIGFGERCGNCNLATIIGDLQLKRSFRCVPEDKLPRLTKTALRIADVSNVTLAASQPYVGSGAFAHKGGMHIDGVKKISESFEHVEPDSVGNRRRFLTSEVSGKATVLETIRLVDPEIEADDPVVRRAVEELKQREFEGYQYEAAEQSFELLIRRLLHRYRPFFRLEYYKVIGEFPLSAEGFPSTTVIKVHVGDESRIAGAEGVGPVHALDVALRRALEQFYPSLREMYLTDFKVRVLERSETTAARVRVLIESTDGETTWTTVGVSSDIMEAAMGALTDSIEYKLTKDMVAPPDAEPRKE